MRHRRMFARVGTATALAVLLSMLVAWAPSSTATAGSAKASVVAKKAKKAGWHPAPGVKFNTPRAGAKQFVLERQVIAAINHAKRNSTIRMVMFSFDRMPVADALIKAKKKRNVTVQVIVNGHEFPKAQKKMKKRLGTKKQARKRKNKSFFYQCKASCRGQGDVQHSKFVLFSHTGKATDVVMLGSLNMKMNGDANQYNDLLTLNRKPTLYKDLDKVFTQMKRDKLAKPAFLDEKIGKSMELYVLPFPKAPKGTKKTRYTVARDPISRILKPVVCSGARVPSKRTAIRVNMHAWDGQRGIMLAKKFRNLYAKGCDVKLLVGYAGKRVRQIFATPTKRGRVPVRSTGYDTNGDGEIDLYSHEKELMINGHYGKARGKKVIVTGSSNYQNGGQYGDELIFKVFSPGLHTKYVRHFNNLWNNHSHGFIFARVLVNGRMKTALIDPWVNLGTNSPEWRDE